ncbi:hypothetical protein HDU76_001551 [Blyttiomyces sp. JEL0837]|nr:hypothetical protein HDU76_001551 [Blyttiomyces sp. JEL0837]
MVNVIANIQAADEDSSSKQDLKPTDSCRILALITGKKHKAAQLVDEYSCRNNEVDLEQPLNNTINSTETSSSQTTHESTSARSDVVVSESTEISPSSDETQVSTRHSLYDMINQCRRLRFPCGELGIGSPSRVSSQSTQKSSLSSWDADAIVSVNTEATNLTAIKPLPYLHDLFNICRTKLRRSDEISSASSLPSLRQSTNESTSLDAPTTVSASIETSSSVATARNLKNQHLFTFAKLCHLVICIRGGSSFGSQQSPSLASMQPEQLSQRSSSSIDAGAISSVESSVSSSPTLQNSKKLYLCGLFPTACARQGGPDSSNTHLQQQRPLTEGLDNDLSNSKTTVIRFKISFNLQNIKNYFPAAIPKTPSKRKPLNDDPLVEQEQIVTPAMKSSKSIFLPSELWMLIITINKHSLNEVAEYSRISRYLRIIFWQTAEVKARLMIDSKFGCLGITNEITVEKNAHQILRAARPRTSGERKFTAGRFEMKYEKMVQFMSQPDSIDVVKRLLHLRALRQVRSVATNGSFYPASFNDLKIHGQMEYNFEKLWTRAAFEAGNYQVSKALRDADFATYHSLHSAAKSDDANLCQILLENGYDVNDVAFDDEKNTPIHVGARSGSVKVAKILVGRGAKIDFRNLEGATPLHEAVETNQLNMIRLLLSVEGSPHEFVETLPSSMVRFNSVGEQCLIGGTLCNLDSRYLRRVSSQISREMALNSHSTPVMIALQADAKDSFTCFLQVASDSDIHVLMRMACELGAINCMEALVVRGAAVEPVCSRFKALGFKSPATISAQKQLYTSVVPNDDWSPLNIAIMHKQDKLVEFFVDKIGCSVNCCGKNNQSPFYTAAGEMGNVPLAKFLLSRNANWNIRVKIDDKYSSAMTGFSALHRAVQRMNVDSVRFLADLWGPEWKSKRYQAHPLDIQQSKTAHTSTSSKLPSCVDDTSSNPVHIATQYLQNEHLISIAEDYVGYILSRGKFEEILKILVSVQPGWLKTCDGQNRTPYDIIRWLSRRPQLEPAASRICKILT